MEIIVMPLDEFLKLDLKDDLPADITWGDLVKEEPRLLGVLRQAQDFPKGVNETFCANRAIGTLKWKLAELVGWDRPESASCPVWLRTSAAWDCAFETVYDALPNCRNCRCM